MDAVKFLMEFNRMHQHYDCEADSEGCPRQREGCSLVDKRKPYFEKLVSDVEKWSKEHPQRTRLQDFREKYPDALMGEDGTPESCCKSLGYCKTCKRNKDVGCTDCWNMPVEEDE